MNLMNLIMQLLGLIDLPRDFPSIRVISFIINLYLILVISVGKGAKNFCQKNLSTKRALRKMQQKMLDCQTQKSMARPLVGTLMLTNNRGLFKKTNNRGQRQGGS